MSRNDDDLGYITIKYHVIDQVVAEALLKGNNRKAAQWESYRDVNFPIQKRNSDGSVVVIDAHGSRVTFDSYMYDEV